MDSSDWNRFDYKAIPRFSGYAERGESLFREFCRIGITNVREFWNAGSPYDALLLRTIPATRMFHKVPRWLSTTLTHLQMAKVGLDLGAEHMLLMEDDVRFLRDIGTLEEVVRTLPEDFDLAMFDYFPSGKAEKDPSFAPSLAGRQVPGAPLWSRGGVARFRSAACYALSRKGAKRYVELLEGAARGAWKMRICDQFLGRMMVEEDLRTYYAYPNAAIQALFERSNTGPGWIRDTYASLGIDRSLYQSYPGEVPA